MENLRDFKSENRVFLRGILGVILGLILGDF